MTSDDQYFLDLLASVPSDIANYGSRIADYIEKHSSSLADELRNAIDSATWIPDSMRPPVRAVSHRFSAPAPPETFFAKTTTWISKNRTAVAVLLAFAGTTAILIHRRKKAHAKKRRARRDRNGKKKEIVVLACSSFYDPLTRSLALDLDRRGYIVYVTVSSTEEDSLVQSESKWDIRPLWMDLTSSVPNPGHDIHPNLGPIRQLIKPSSRASSPVSDKSSPSTSNSSHHSLAGLILLPGSTGYPTGPLATLPPTDLIDTINTRLLSPILIAQQFIPLLGLAERQPHTSSPFTTKTPHLPTFPSIILAYPSIPSSLHPPHQTPETITTTSLASFTRCLRHELHPTSGLIITELKLGLFDLGSVAPRAPKAGDYVYPHPRPREQQVAQPSRYSAPTHWHSSQRAAAQQSLYAQQPAGNVADKARGSSLREFHNAIFDILNPGPRFKAFGIVPWGASGCGSKAGRTVYVGQGARVYDLVGKWVPDGLVGWLVRRQQGSRNGSEGVEVCGNGTEESQAPVGEADLPIGGASSTTSESAIWEKV
jgi:Fungal family of unknown function (DUF1776)